MKDLRKLTREMHASSDDIVPKGIYKDKGMASFADLHKPDEVDAIHGYLIARANEDWGRSMEKAEGGRIRVLRAAPVQGDVGQSPKLMKTTCYFSSKRFFSAAAWSECLSRCAMSWACRERKSCEMEKEPGLLRRIRSRSWCREDRGTTGGL